MVRPIGVFRMADEAGATTSCCASPTRTRATTRYRDLDDVDRHSFLLDEIEHFFQVYKDVEPGKDTEPGHWEDAASARRIVGEARARHPDRARAA